MLFVLTNHLIFFILAFLWLVLLKLFKRLNTLPFYVSLTALIFFLYYIPTPVDSFENEMDDLTVHLTGKIVSNIDKTDQKIQFSLQKRSTRKKYLIVHFSKDDKRLNKERLQTLKYGATCQLKG